MKKRQFCSILLCFVVTLIPFKHVNAEDLFPEFQKGSSRLYIPIEAISFAYEEDLEHEVGFNFSYNINGQLFTNSSQGHIQTLQEGFSGISDRMTPWKTLTELLAAYQKSDLEAVRSLYTAGSQPVINEWLSTTEAQTKFMNFMKSIQGMNILLGFEHKNGFLALVDVDYGIDDPLFDKDVTPFFFVQTDSQYLLSYVSLDEPIDTNISIFLQTGHSVTELLAPKYGLHIEKSGTGDGSVRGTGIDCGEDCIEVFTEGTTTWLKAEPDEYSTFEGWFVDGEPLHERLVMQEDQTVTAVFNNFPPQEYTLTVEISGTGSGTVTDSATICDVANCLELFSLHAGAEEATLVQIGIDCGEVSSVTYTEGTKIVLNAVTAEGSEFIEWQINDETISDSIEVTGDMTVTAIFDIVTPSADPPETTLP